MAVRPLRPVILLAAVLSLGSCQILEFVFSSVFPASATLAKGQVDLSSKIPSGSGTSFYLRVVETGGYGYVVLIGTPTSSGNLSTAYIFDFDLNLKSTQTNLPTSSGVTADGAGYVATGTTQLNPSDLSVASTGKAQVFTSGNLGVDGFVDGSPPADNIYGLSMSGGIYVNYGYAAPDWSAFGVTITPPVISYKYSNLQLDAVLDDGNPIGNAVLVISPPYGGDRIPAYFVTLPKSSFTAAYAAGIMDTSPNRDDLEIQSFGFSQGSIFAYQKSTSSYVRIDPSTGNITDSISGGVDPKTTRFAYRTGGGSFYGFDTNTRVLTKYVQWW